MPGDILPSNLSNGRALWGVHSLWARVLEEWLNKNNGSDVGLERWPAVEFDKLAHLTHLVWNALKSRQLVTFVSPYESADGIHGPGPALRLRQRGYWHALRALEHLQERFRENPDALLFDLDKPGVKPGHPKTYMPVQASQLLPPPYQGKDLHYLRQVAVLFSCFSMQEIRVLGTHQTRQGTAEAIEYNAFVHFAPRLFAEIDAIRSGKPAKHDGDIVNGSDLPPLSHVIEEIQKKSGDNRVIYEAAYQRLSDAATNGDEVAEIALDDVFEKPSHIWDRDVSGWQSIVPVLSDCHSYVRWLNRLFRPHEPGLDAETRRRQTDRLRREHDEAVEAGRRLSRMYTVSLPELPPQVLDGFDWNSLIWGLAEVYGRLPGSSRYRGYFDRYVSRIVTKN